MKNIILGLVITATSLTVCNGNNKSTENLKRNEALHLKST